MSLESSRFLVTGGTGSFGNFLVHHLINIGAREVRVLSRDEKKQHDMRVLFSGTPNLSFVIGDVRDPKTAYESMFGIDAVIQAAALKQVPTCERFPMESVRTNVNGVDNLVAAALEHKVQRFVTISTDKAVKPVNIMGMTKAIQERLVLLGNISRKNSGTRFCCVRYGNVLRSRGSVVPLFRRQLKRGRNLTITDIRMTRFLLTLRDAIDLVMYAVENTEGGEIFVRKAPSARIVDIAAVLCEEAGQPLLYDLLGILPGEKLSEILVSEEELERTEDMGGYYKIYPHWYTRRPRQLEKEYCSADHVADIETVRALIERSDGEFSRLELSDGEFIKF